MMATAKIIELDDTNTCKICDNAHAKYSCPRCNILYCSLTCYQSQTHLECSENFYKDNVMEELNIDKNSEESKTKMLEILQRFHEQNKVTLSDQSDQEDGEHSDFEDDLAQFSQFVDIEDLEEALDSDDDEYLDITERLAGVNLDDAEKVWEKLTEDEKQEFVAFLKTEDVTKLIPSWQPWWTYFDDSKVEDMNKKSSKDYETNCPKIIDIKDFTTITTKTPADCVKYNLINILAAYIFTTRYFNGEHFDFCMEATSCVATISITLKIGQNLNDFDTAVKSVEQECINSDWIMTDAENIQTMRNDLEKILKGPKTTDKKYYLLCALSDLHNLMTSSLRSEDEANNASAFSKKFPNDHFPHVKLEAKDKIKNYVKKVEYFLSYAKDCFSM